MVRRRRWVRRRGPDRYAVAVPSDAREVLDRLLGELRALLGGSTDDPALRRLFPTAYHEDPELDQGYQVLARDELLERRLAALDAVQASIHAQELDEAALTAWMTAVNDVRLVLGTVLDVSEDQEPVDADDAEAPRHAAYGFLTHVLGEIVDALAGGLGDEDRRR
jgi:predicted transcriptional regulator